MIKSFHPAASDAGRRLDQYLVEQIPEASRARIQQLISRGKVEVNGEPAKASLRLRGEEEVMVLGPATPPPLKATPEDIPLDVVYEDAALAVVNKPAGMMVHAGAGAADSGEEAPADPRTRGTLVNALLFRFRKLSQEGGDLRPGIVHRLDKETSGLMVVAKSDRAHRRLAEQFSERQVEKTYLALVHGVPKSASGTIDTLIGRDPSRRQRMSVRTRDGRSAVSHYRVIDAIESPYGRFALIEVRIETGRTHQIRVHMASLGHPVVGDTVYGAPAKILPVPGSRPRAMRASTKATRDRATSDRARQQTEKRLGIKAGKRPVAAMAVGALPARSLSRNFLHAAKLAFDHPTGGKRMTFAADLPAELQAFLREITPPTE